MRTGGWMVMAMCCVLAPAHASAYRTFADDPAVGVPARWPDARVAWDLDISTLSGELTPGQIESAVAMAFQTIASARCDALVFTSLGPSTRPAAPADGRNTVSVVSRDWLGRGFSADQGAHTDVQIEVGADGHARIVEADIYLNFDLYTFQTAETGEGLDLIAVALHEGLHLAGLLHPCELEASSAPLCDASPEARLSALYPIYALGAGRSLGDDDEAGLCALYGDCVPSCPMGASCVDGACLPDPCVDPGCTACEDECGGERCAAGGCGAGVCATVGAAAGYCVPEGSVGAPCEGASDCMSGLCLTSTRVGRHCTAACSTDAECGADQACASVDGQRVCAPRPAASSCAVGRSSSMLGVLAAVSLVWLSRRRRRS